jgi:hypothetical protein
MSEENTIDQKKTPIEEESLKFKEFMNFPMEMNNRSSLPYSDELVIRKAKIYKILGPKDDRVQCIVLPECMSIKDDEMDNLPKYPPFIKGTVITGKSKKDDGDEADFVWVLCTPDLQIGYVLGPANIFGDPTKKYKDSYSWTDIKSFLRERRALPDDFDYKHIRITNWFASDKGGLLEFYNYLTGDLGIINTSGSIFTLQQKKMYLRVGTPSSGGRSAFSAITLTADRVHIKSPNFELDCDQVLLAHNNLNALGTVSSSVLIGKNGISANAVMNVKL